MTAKEKTVFGINDFIKAAQGEKHMTVDTIVLAHTGDTATISLAGQESMVGSVTIQVKMRVQSHTSGLAGKSSDKTISQKHVIDGSSGDYQITCKEQYEQSGGEGLGLIIGATYVDNVDIWITLLDVVLLSGTQTKIGQDATSGGGIPWPVIIDGITWVVAGLCIGIGVYMLYRVWRWKKHGDPLFPHIGGVK